MDAFTPSLGNLMQTIKASTAAAKDYATKPDGAEAKPDAKPTMGRDSFQRSRPTVDAGGAYAPDDPKMSAFRTWDKNKDGYLTKAENHPMVDFQKADKSGDGKLSPVEWINGMNAASFERHDANRDGQLSGDELAKTDALPEAYRQVADRNADGGISPDEFRAAKEAATMFGPAPDSNMDGLLSGNEVPTKAWGYGGINEAGRPELKLEAFLDQRLGAYAVQRRIDAAVK